MPPKAAIDDIEQLYRGIKKHHFERTGNAVGQFRFVQWHRSPKPEYYYNPKSGICALIYQAEICPKSGKFHYQGYAQLSVKLRFNQIYKLNPIRYWIDVTDETTGEHATLEVEDKSDADFKTGAYIGICNGSAQQNIDYCSKTKSREPGFIPVQIGVFRGTSQVLDIRKMFSEVANGTFDHNASIDHLVFLAKQRRVVDEIRRVKLEDEIRERDLSDTKLYILFGRSGAGKTYDAKYGVWESGKKTGYDLENRDWYLVPDYYVTNGMPLFDRYSGQKRLILDEVDKRSEFPIDWIINACSDEAFECPCRGSGTKLRGWTEIFLIMNDSPEDFFKNKRSASALLRRVTKVVYYKSRYNAEIEELANRTWASLTYDAMGHRPKPKKRVTLVDDDVDSIDSVNSQPFE